MAILILFCSCSLTFWWTPCQLYSHPLLSLIGPWQKYLEYKASQWSTAINVILLLSEPRYVSSYFLLGLPVLVSLKLYSNPLFSLIGSCGRNKYLIEVLQFMACPFISLGSSPHQSLRSPLVKYGSKLDIKCIKWLLIDLWKFSNIHVLTLSFHQIQRKVTH